MALSSPCRCGMSSSTTAMRARRAMRRTVSWSTDMKWLSENGAEGCSAYSTGRFCAAMRVDETPAASPGGSGDHRIRIGADRDHDHPRLLPTQIAVHSAGGEEKGGKTQQHEAHPRRARDAAHSEPPALDRELRSRDEPRRRGGFDRLDDAPDGNDVDGADRPRAPAGLGGRRLAVRDRRLFGTAQPLRPGGEALDRERLFDSATRSFAGGAGDGLDAPATAAAPANSRPARPRRPER